MVILILVQFGNLAATEDLPSVFNDFLTGYIPQPVSYTHLDVYKRQVYPGKQTDLSAITDGAEIAVPNDTTNEARALLLLQEQGLITLNDGAGITATVNDIKENPHKIKFVELAAEQIPRSLPDFDFAVINGNYALEAGLNASTDALATETSDSDAVKKYVNVIAVKEGNENNEGIKALVEVLKSEEIKKFINDTYQGSVVPYEG